LSARLTVAALVSLLVSLALAANASGFGFVRSWGTEGVGDGQFESPGAIAVDATGNVYVADTGNNRIQKFDSQGNFLLQWGSFGSGNGQFKGPRGIAADSAGDVIVADTLNNRFQKFSPIGGFLFTFGAFGTTNNSSDFQFPIGIGSDPNAPVASHTILTADSGNARVLRYTTNSSAFIRDLTFAATVGLAAPTDATQGVSAMFVADPTTNSIRVYNRNSGAALTTFGASGAPIEQLSGPASVEVQPGPGPADIVWVADTRNNRITRWGAQGANAFLTTSIGSLGDCPGQFRSPQGIAATAAGEVYVADTGNNRIVEFGPSGDGNASCPVEPDPVVPPPPDTDPPDTTLDAPTKVKTRKSKANVTVTFGADEPATFTCRIDGGLLATCASPATFSLRKGKHVIEVIATDTAGNSDSDPPVATVKVVRKRHK
jgi:hypothetical protein